MDRMVTNEKAVVKANYVLSFQTPKLVFFLSGTGVYSNQWEVTDIGLDPEFMAQVDTAFQVIGKDEVLPMYVPREKFFPQRYLRTFDNHRW